MKNYTIRMFYTIYRTMFSKMKRDQNPATSCLLQASLRVHVRRLALLKPDEMHKLPCSTHLARSCEVAWHDLLFSIAWCFIAGMSYSDAKMDDIDKYVADACILLSQSPRE